MIKENSGDDNFWHTKTKDTIFQELGTSEKGLSKKQIEIRIQKEGLN